MEEKKRNSGSQGGNTYVFPGNNRSSFDDQMTGSDLRASKSKRQRRFPEETEVELPKKPRTHLAGEGVYAPTYAPDFTYTPDDEKNDEYEDAQPRTKKYVSKKNDNVRRSGDGEAKKRPKAEKPADKRGTVTIIHHTDDRVSARDNTKRYPQKNAADSRNSDSGDTYVPRNRQKKGNARYEGRIPVKPDETERTESVTIEFPGAGDDYYAPTPRTKKPDVYEKTARDTAQYRNTKKHRTEARADDTEINGSRPGVRRYEPYKNSRADERTVRSGERKRNGAAPTYNDTGRKASTKKPHVAAEINVERQTAPKKRPLPDSPRYNSTKNRKDASGYAERPAKTVKRIGLSDIFRPKKKHADPRDIRITHPSVKREKETPFREVRPTKKKERTSWLDKPVEMKFPALFGISFVRLLIAGLLTVLLVVIVTAVWPRFAGKVFKVRSITVSGNTEYDKAAIRESSGIKTGMSLSSVDAAGAERKIELSNPYVDASVKKSILGAVTITVCDRVPYAAVDCGKEVLLISEDFTALEFTDAGDARLNDYILLRGVGTENYKLSQVIGNTATDPHLHAAMLVLRAIKESERSFTVTAIDLFNCSEIVCTLSGNLYLKLGNTENLADKLDTAETLLRTLRLQGYGDGGTLDVSVDGRYVMSPEEVEKNGVGRGSDVKPSDSDGM